ncbi:hypothetical protein Bca101_096947 [Brassica carinata]
MMAEINRRMQASYNRAQQANDIIPDDVEGQERVAADAAERLWLEVIGSMVSKCRKIQLMRVIMNLRVANTADTITAGDQLIT